MSTSLLLAFIGFILGLCIGSFLNLVADRLITGENIFFSRSHCEFCMKTLKTKNLIPVVSFVQSGGRCCYCHKPLSLCYPFSELLTAIIFALIFYSYSTNLLQATYITVVFCSFIIVLLADLKYGTIPDVIVLPTAFLALLYNIGVRTYSIVVNHQTLSNDGFGKYLLQAGYLNNLIFSDLRDLSYMLFSTSIIFVFFWFLIFITKGKGMGGGDMKLGLLIGLFNGFPYNFLAIFMGFLTGSVISLCLIVLGRKTLKDTIPFGPFLILGSILAYLYGTQIITWYLTLI